MIIRQVVLVACVVLSVWSRVVAGVALSVTGAVRLCLAGRNEPVMAMERLERYTYRTIWRGLE